MRLVGQRQTALSTSWAAFQEEDQHVLLEHARLLGGETADTRAAAGEGGGGGGGGEVEVEVAAVLLAVVEVEVVPLAAVAIEQRGGGA